MDNIDTIQIDLQQVIDNKLGSKARYVPGWLVRRLQKMICQDELNHILRLNAGKRGADFCDGVLSYLDATIHIADSSKLPEASDSRVIFACNHPLGGLDGIALISLLGHYYGPGVRFVVNDLLMAVEPLNDVFLPINKHGAQSRQAADDINKVMAADMPVLVFPAGLVSRLQGSEVRDLDWHKMFINKAVQFHRDIIPVYFSGRNSSFFYNFAKWRKRVGIKFNIEMVRLPKEMLLARGSDFEIVIGNRIPWQSLKAGKEATNQAAAIKEIVYNLPSTVNNNRP